MTSFVEAIGFAADRLLRRGDRGARPLPPPPPEAEALAARYLEDLRRRVAWQVEAAARRGSTGTAAAGAYEPAREVRAQIH